MNVSIQSRLRAAAVAQADPSTAALLREAATTIDVIAGHAPALERDLAELRAAYKDAGGHGALTMAKARRAMQLFAETENEA